jgi:membrane-bound lytic murein transglycosylase D
MRLQKLYVVIAPLAAALASCGCQSHRSAPLLSAKQSAPPALAAAASPVRSAETQAPAIKQAEPATETAATSLSADPVADLIAKVEKEYAAGQDNYKAGHLDAARQNFDRAFDLLLGSNLEIDSDPRLENEFDRIVEGVNSFDMQALQQGDGFTEQKSEPAPIDEANEAAVPVDANVKAKAEAEIKSTRSDLPLMMTDQVAGYITYFSGRGRGTLENALVRSGRYEDMIRRILKQEGVPQDLIYLAQAESGFHPRALARRRPRHLAVHGEPGKRLRTAARLVGRRSSGSGEGHASRGTAS